MSMWTVLSLLFAGYCFGRAHAAFAEFCARDDDEQGRTVHIDGLTYCGVRLGDDEEAG